MTQDLRTPPVERSGEDALDDLGGGATVSVADILDRIWRLLTSRRLGLVLILLTGVLTLVGTLVPQAPAGMLSDKQAYASWVNTLRPKWAGWTTVLDKLGLLHTFSSIGFKVVITLLAMSILACSINRTPKLWRQAVRPRVHRGDTFFAHAPVRAEFDVPGDPAARLDDVRAVLRRHRFRIIDDPATPNRGLYADQFRWGPFGTILAHVSFVLIMIGMVLTAATGFKDTGFAAPVDTRVDVGHGTGLSVLAKSFTDTYYPNGEPRDYASDVVLYHDGRAVTEKTIRVNQPLRWGGVSFYQENFGSAAAIRVTDAKGGTVYDSAVPLQYSSDDGQHVIGTFSLAAQGLNVYVVSPASGATDPNIGAGQMQLEIYKNGTDTPAAIQVLTQGKQAAIDGVSGLNFTFQREQRYTMLIVARDPGATYVWAGSALMVLGLFMVFFFPHRRLWVRVHRTDEGARVTLASPMRKDAALKSRLARITTDIQQAAAGGEGK